MKRSLLTAILICGISYSAQADIRDEIAAYREEIVEMRQVHRTRYDRPVAQQLIRDAFTKAGIEESMHHADNWGDQVYLTWTRVEPIYQYALYRLNEWSWASPSERSDAADVSEMMAAGMTLLRGVDREVEGWFADDVANWTERALWLDAAEALGCCGDGYQRYGELANSAFDDSIFPDPHAVGRIEIFAAVPEEGALLGDWRGQRLARLTTLIEEAIASGDASEVRRAMQTARMSLAGVDTAEASTFAELLRILEERMSLQAVSVGDILDQAEALPDGVLRTVMLDMAQDELLARTGHLAPILAAQAGTEEERDSAATQVLDGLRRLSMLRDDAIAPLTPASGWARAASGLTAAAQLLDIANRGDATATEFNDITNNLGSAASRLRFAPTAPFAGHAGAIASQLDQVREAWGHAADALDGVAQAIGGDTSGLDRAIAASRLLDESLDPRLMVAEMTDGFIEGIASNIPFARSIIGWFDE